MSKPKLKWKLIEHFPIQKYRCGARVGDCVRLKQKLVIRDLSGKRTGKVYPAGDTWTVINGAKESPRVLWLRASDKTYHTWDDNDVFWTCFDAMPKRNRT